MAQNPLSPPPVVKQDQSFDRWMRLLWHRMVVEGQILWTQVIRPTKAKNTFLAGPSSGADAQVDFREIVAADLPDSFVNVVWGTPGAESGDAIEIQATVETLDGTAFSTGLVAVQVTVSDSAADNEPSATATLSAATTPVGTLLAGGTTATAIFLTNASGAFKVKVSEAASASRYLWVKAGGHCQLFVKAKDGIQQITFA